MKKLFAIAMLFSILFMGCTSSQSSASTTSPIIPSAMTPSPSENDLDVPSSAGGLSLPSFNKNSFSCPTIDFPKDLMVTGGKETETSLAVSFNLANWPQEKQYNLLDEFIISLAEEIPRV